MTFNPLRYRSQLLAQATQRREVRTVSAEMAGESLHLQLLSLEQDLRRLKDLPRIVDRIELKARELLPKWLPYVERYLAAQKIYEYPVFAWCVIWLFDVSEIDKALEWADIAIAQNQPTPERLRARFPAFVADHVLAWAQGEAQAGRSIEPYFTRTFTNIRENWRLHEKPTAKWFKFAGELLLRDRDGKPAATAIDDIPTLKKANELLAQAEGFHKKIGVETLRKRIESRIRALEKKAEEHAAINTAP
ncbi:terminase [Yersinia pseudotuberculosis]|uniref:Small terminase subunit n=1 Tax=Yersinia pseudotuberculosis serotype O:3 (strain YPIII) TaxID=502800 RepID=A0A0H3B1D8_YERPY|nr:phage terminase small subunit [Yersinia pseudotuberculosis]AJJ60550.1 phage small terminase subunit [Yersinia pseudotuberculosis YPIII]AYW86999.1 terminase [Yersinia pseudotuberculosis]AYX01603.1 terminase [Yersinia pseudotuberculosis]AZA29357.1 terminase [Yersinia pseudotuberculosis]MBK1425890.1 terminase [Yersinia pseudotuberculosis]